MQRLRISSLILVVLITLLWLGLSSLGFPTLASPLTILPQPEPPFRGKISRTVQQSVPDFPQPRTAPKNAPNILLVLLDDVGYGQFGTFGGGIPSPVLDNIAQNGIRYTQFHSTAMCSPTRAALLTGRNHHSVGTGALVEMATGFPGYTGILPKSAATIAQVLQGNGYSTAWFGKNHNIPIWERSEIGPFDHWPSKMGFDYFYGFITSTNSWAPTLFENTVAVEVPRNKQGVHLTTLLVDKSIEWVRKVKTIDPNRPFFLYFSPFATHSPHHAPQQWVDMFRGQFDMGWDEYREKTFDQQKKLGVVPADAKLTPRPQEIPAWNSLTSEQQQLYARMMEVFAGYSAHTDSQIGRLVGAINELGELDNTLIIYVVGDNGASAEGDLAGLVNEVLDMNGIPESLADKLNAMNSLGSRATLNHFPVGWAWAMNTPFQWAKQVASHFGGIRNPLVISWPAKIKDKSIIRYQFHHVIDVFPTILEATGIAAPSEVNGIPQQPVEGVSMVYTWDAANTNAKSQHNTQYFEMLSNRGIYQDGWMASSIASIPWVWERQPKDIDSIPWELYHTDEDFSQAENLADKYPAKLKQLQDLFWQEAKRYNVLPLDNRIGERFRANDRPSLTGDRTRFTYYPGMLALPGENAPDIKNKSYRLTAQFEIPPDGAEGILMTHGGRFGGYGLFMENGKLIYVYNYGNVKRYRIESNQPIATGTVTAEYRFDYDGGKLGSGGTGRLYVNSRLVGEGRIDQTLPQQLTLGETFDVGVDMGTPVDESYAAKMPFRFTGQLDKVSVDLGKSQLENSASKSQGEIANLENRGI
jgi:arylsulfatase A-like enzyme